jgi:hypothetical protein
MMTWVISIAAAIFFFAIYAVGIWLSKKKDCNCRTAKKIVDRYEKSGRG